MRLDININFPGLEGVCRALSSIITNQEKIMTTVTELSAKLDALDEAITQERTEVVNALTGLKGEIQTLKDQIAAGTPVSQEQLDAIGARVDAQITKTQGIITDADTAAG